MARVAPVKPATLSQLELTPLELGSKLTHYAEKNTTEEVYV